MIVGIFKIRKLVVVVTNRFMNEFKSERIMRKIGYFLFATALITLGSCSDDTVVEEKPVTPAEVGEEIRFGSSLKEVGSRTVYDDIPENGAYRVSWEADGSDQVAIYCPQAAQTKLVKYSVTPDSQDPTHSSTVTKLNPDEAGLQWGSDPDHHFYAFYPASRVTGTEDGKIEGIVPTTQNVTSWNIQENNEEGGKTYYGKTNTDNAYMWAYGNFNRETMGNQDVPLTFHPWMTVLEITIRGPQSGTKTVTNVNIRAIEGTQTALAGGFVCDMTPVEENKENGIPNYEPISSGTVNNTISISGYNSETQEFIELGPNDKMVVRAYLLPIDEQNATDARNIQISVATLNGAALTRTLGYSAAGANSIQPHKVNRVTLPRLVDTGTNYWMSSLDKDIYLSEISMPGSKFSYLSADNGASAPYQGASLEHQFIDGVRAFMVQVGVDATYHATRTQTGSDWLGRPEYSYSYAYESSTLNVQGAPSGTTLANTIENLAQQLETAENALNDRNLESAVLMVTATGEPESVNFTGNPQRFAGINTVGGGWKVWIEAVTTELQKLSETAQNRIYTGEITANTTLDDVKGKIVLKINYNEQSQESDVAADATYPMLFSRWDGIQNEVPLRWGSPNTGSSRSPLTWYYQEATHIGGGSQGTATQKWNNIQTVFQNSVTMYQNNDAHDTWFMNDCGGKFYGSVTDAGEYNGNYNTSESGDTRAITSFTNWISPQVTRYLQTRDANASLGLVYFNFADKQPTSGAQYGVDYMIQTVIDNNFKFNLRKEGSTTNTTSYDAAYSNGGNVWD